MKSLVAVLACLALAGLCQGYTDTGECPQVVNMLEFDLQRYLGAWYKIQAMPYSSNINVPQHCLKIAYWMSSESTVGIGEVVTWSLEAIEIIYREDYTTTAVPGELTSVHGGISVYILDTDYDTYASYYECSVDGETRHQEAAIISRTKELDLAIVESQMEIFESSNVDFSSFVPVLHEEFCTYPNITAPP